MAVSHLTVQQAADLLGVSRGCMYWRIQQGVVDTLTKWGAKRIIINDRFWESTQRGGHRGLIQKLDALEMRVVVLEQRISKID